MDVAKHNKRVWIEWKSLQWICEELICYRMSCRKIWCQLFLTTVHWRRSRSWRAVWTVCHTKWVVDSTVYNLNVRVRRRRKAITGSLRSISHVSLQYAKYSLHFTSKDLSLNFAWHASTLYASGRLSITSDLETSWQQHWKAGFYLPVNVNVNRCILARRLLNVDSLIPC